MKILRLAITVLILSGYVLILSGCGSLVSHKADTRELSDEVKVKISVGDTRKKVRSIFGEPSVNIPSHKMEVYKKSDRDFDVIWVFAPWAPVPILGEKAIGVVFVIYDEQDLVKELAADVWEEPPRGAYGYDEWVLKSGEFSFVNIYNQEPTTLLGPPVIWQELAASVSSEKNCSLVIVMGQCPMEKISIDHNQIADFYLAGGYCDVDGPPPDYEHHNLLRTFLWKEISPGNHRLRIHQRIKFGNMETTFDCAPGETIYAELEPSKMVPDTWYSRRLEGVITISKSITNNIVELGELRPILWHQGTWYGLPKLNSY
jgi:uncharacterized protein YceK